MKILIINGPNINLLGIREPQIYGEQTYRDLIILCETYGRQHGCECIFFQSNHEGAIVDVIQKAKEDGMDGIVINSAAYAHTSIAILDALKAVQIPAVNVHISDVSKRDSFRQLDYTAMACKKTIIGKGLAGYTQAIDYLLGQIDL